MTSHSEFGVETSATEVAKTFAEEIVGRNVLITGVSPESIGASMALAVASQNPNKLILASRTKSKLDEVVEKVKSTHPNVDVQSVLVDLSSQESIKKAANEVNQAIPKLDIIINNAGLMVKTRQWTAEKIEMQLGTNHIGPFLLTNLLLDKMREAAKGSTSGATRVVNLTSLGHRLSPVRFHDYNFEGKEMPDEEKPWKDLPPNMLGGEDGYSGFLAYGQSKTANILFSVHLAQSLQSQGITSFSVHPGSIWTGLSRDLDPDGVEAIQRTSKVWKNQDQGAATALVAAFDPSLNNVGGGFLHDCQLIEPADYAKSPENAEKLWKLSEELTGSQFKL